MKRFILLLNTFVLVLAVLGCTQKNKQAAVKSVDDNTTYVSIPDANFKAFLLENFDANKDGEISLAEAKAVTDLDCSGKNIKKLDGIEKFTNLESLNCSNNQLEE